MPQTPNEDGKFPIAIVNNGDIDLEIKKVNIQSCYMKNNEWKHYYPDDIPIEQRDIIYFLDEKTYNKSKIIDCINRPLDNWESRRMNITMCENITSGEIFLPEKNNSFIMCGFCHWNISIETNKQNFNFYEEMFLPINFSFEVISEKEVNSPNITSPDFICSDNIMMTYYGTRELEIVGEYD
jgi:hypothetical protein